MSFQQHQNSFQTLVNDLQERVANLRTFDSDLEINAHCDDLESDVMLAIDSAIKYLKKTELELLAEINKYRVETLSVNAIRVGEILPLNGKSHKLKESLTALSVEIDAFASNTEKAETVTSTETDYERLKAEALELANKTRSMRVRIREEAFKKRFLKFNINNSFFAANPFGQLVYSSEDAALPCIYRIESLTRTLHNPQKARCQVARMVHENSLVLGSVDGQITLIDSDLIYSDQPIKIHEHTLNMASCVTEIAEYDQQSFLMANLRGAMASFLYHASTQFLKADGFFSLHNGVRKNGTSSIKVLKNGLIVKLSLDDEITVVCPFSSKIFSRTITGHGCTEIPCQLGVLSNQYVVSCSNDTDDCKIRVWDPVSCRKIREKSTGLSRVCSLAVLSTDDIVVASMNGCVKMISLADNSLDKMIIGPRESNYTKFIEVLPNDHILIVDSLTRPHIQIWNPQTSQLIQSWDTEHTAELTYCCLSPNFEHLVTTSLDGSVKIWEVECRLQEF